MADPLKQAKAARNAAHEAFRSQLAQVQQDLAARGIGGRIADRTADVLAEAAEVAEAHKGVIAGTIAALAAWFLRVPILRAASHFWPRNSETERNEND